MLCTVNSYSCVKRHASAAVYRNACGVLCAVVSVLRLCCVYILHRYSVVAIVAVHKTIQCTIIDHDLPYCCFFFLYCKTCGDQSAVCTVLCTAIYKPAIKKGVVLSDPVETLCRTLISYYHNLIFHLYL